MALVPPTPPVVPALVPFVRPGAIINNITPFTYRDGITYLEYLEKLKVYIDEVLVPFIDTQFDVLEDKWGDDMQGIIDAVNQALADQSANVDAALATTITNVNDALADQTAENDTKITNLTTYVNDQVAMMNEQVNDLTAYVNSVAFQDQNVHDIIASTTSLTRTLLDQLYANGSGDSDAAVAGYINDPDSLTRAALDDLFEAQEVGMTAVQRARAILSRSNRFNSVHVGVLGGAYAAGDNIYSANSFDPTDTRDQGFPYAFTNMIQSIAPSGTAFERALRFAWDTLVPTCGVDVVLCTDAADATVTTYYSSADLDAMLAKPEKTLIWVHAFSEYYAYPTIVPSDVVTSFDATITKILAQGNYGAAPNLQPVHIFVHGAFNYFGTATNAQMDAVRDAMQTYAEAHQDNVIFVDASEPFKLAKDSYTTGVDRLDLFEQSYKEQTDPPLSGSAALLSTNVAYGIADRIRDALGMSAQYKPLYPYTENGRRPINSSNIQIENVELQNGKGKWNSFPDSAFSIGGMIQGPNVAGEAFAFIPLLDSRPILELGVTITPHPTWKVGDGSGLFFGSAGDQSNGVIICTSIINQSRISVYSRLNNVNTLELDVSCNEDDAPFDTTDPLSLKVIYDENGYFRVYVKGRQAATIYLEAGFVGRPNVAGLYVKKTALVGVEESDFFTDFYALPRG